jgi:rubrerythrin
MNAEKDDLLQALIDAYLMEKKTKEFYTQASNKAVTPEVKKAFQKLSEWEKKHMAFIQFLYESIQDNREINSFEEFQKIADAPLTEAGIPAYVLEKKLERYRMQDEKQVLTLALEIEGKAYNLYRGLSMNASDKNAQVVFKEMMEQEVKHVNHLKKMRLKLEEPY